MPTLSRTIQTTLSNAATEAPLRAVMRTLAQPLASLSFRIHFILLTEIAKVCAPRRSESPPPRARRNLSLIDCVLTDSEVRDAHRSPMPTAASRSTHHPHRGGNPVSLCELSARL